METPRRTHTHFSLSGPFGKGRLLPSLDGTDIRILNILQENADLHVNYIANQVYKSTSSTHERIRKMREHGVIQKYIAILDRRLVGRPTLVVTMVRLKQHATFILEGFAAEVNSWPEVQYCLHLSGEFDFVLHVSLRDTQEYGEFLNEKLCGLEAVERVQSSVVLKECKSMAALPL